jgi:hypothetical protein
MLSRGKPCKAPAAQSETAQCREGLSRLAAHAFAPESDFKLDAYRLEAHACSRCLADILGLSLLSAQALAPGSDTKLEAETLEAVAGSAPLVELPADQVLGRLLTEVMAAAQLQDSKSAARRLIKVCKVAHESCNLIDGTGVELHAHVSVKQGWQKDLGLGTRGCGGMACHQMPSGCAILLVRLMCLFTTGPHPNCMFPGWWRPGEQPEGDG